MANKRKKRPQVVIEARTLADVCADLEIEAPKRFGPHSWQDGVHRIHAGRVMDVLSTWARADLEMQRLLLPLMDGEHSLVARMLSDASWHNIYKAISLAAGARLDKPAFDEFKTAFGTIRDPRRRRNIYAHWIKTWHCDFPDAMLFINPVYLAGVNADLYAAADGAPAPRDEWYPEINPKYVLFYEDSDITTDHELVVSVLEVLLFLREYLSQPQDAAALERLQRRYRSLEVVDIRFPPDKP